jgi:putative transposase
VAAGQLPGLLKQVRAGLARGAHGQPARRDRRGRARLTEAARLAGLTERDEQGNVVPLVTLVTDNGGPLDSFRFEAFIATHLELCHVRTRVKSSWQKGSRERGFGSLEYEMFFLEKIPDALNRVAHAEDYRVEYNTVRPHEALAENRPRDVHLRLADPLIPDFPS